MSGSGFLPYGRQSIDQADIDAVVEVLRSPFLTQGPAVERFEAAIAAETGAPHAVACSNGTTALHLACVALDVGPGDAAIVPAITFMATANAARYAGAEVVFADIDPDSGLMGLPEAEAAVAAATARGLKPKVLMPVHLAGQPADPVGIAALAQRHGLAVIEDGCHAIGTRYSRADGSQAAVGDGATAACTAFSFHPVKTVATGEGGALTTADAALAERLRRLRSHGIVREADAFANRDIALAPDGTANPWYHEMAELGFNYRLSDLQCALGLSQMRRIRGFVEKRQALVACYDRLLAPLAPLVRPLRQVPGASPAWHLQVALIDFAGIGIDRATVMTRLRARGIGSQVHYIPVPEQPYYRSRYGRPDLPGAQRYYARALSLPLYPEMDEADVARVAGALAEVLT